MSKFSRDKGRRGQREAKKLLESHLYTVTEINSGTACADFIAQNECGINYAVEVKNQKNIRLADFIKQAKAQAKDKKMRWLLLVRLGSGCGWLRITENGITVL